MREKRGKLIAVWVPGNHGAGGSTMANAAAITLQHITSYKTLLVNWGSSRNYMEQYLKNDVEFRFSLDHLKSFDLALQAEHIRTYATAINESLSVLPNCRFTYDLSKVASGFDALFIERALEAYELVVIDVEAGVTASNRFILDQADVILAVMNENIIALEDLYYTNDIIRSYLNKDNAFAVFNGLHAENNERKQLRVLNGRLGLKSCWGISYDIKANKAACFEGRFYSYFKNVLDSSKASESMPAQIQELCSIIAEKLFIPTAFSQQSSSVLSNLLGRVKHWRELNA